MVVHWVELLPQRSRVLGLILSSVCRLCLVLNVLLLFLWGFLPLYKNMLVSRLAMLMV